MRGYTIQKSIDLLEKEVANAGGGGGASTAADVSYDNTSSGLTADDVQEAIDEIAEKMGLSFGATETKIGTFLNEDMYARVYDLESDLTISTVEFTTTTIPATDISKLLFTFGIYSTGSSSYPLIGTIADSVIKLQSGRNGSGAFAYCRYIALIYTKAAPVSSKKTKKK